MGLQHLPVLPGLMDNVKNNYIKEVHAVNTPEEMKAFVERWRPLFQLEVDSPRWKQWFNDGHQWVCNYYSKKAYLSLIDGTCDYAQALGCLLKGRTKPGTVQMEGEICEHAEHFSCAGMHLAIPLTMLHCEEICSHFGVTSDIALIQSNGGYSEEFQP